MSTATESRPTRRVLTANVSRRERLSPSFARVTLAGGGMAHFAYQGYDQWFRMFLPRERSPLALPTGEYDDAWYAQYIATADTERPCMRYVTVRDRRPDGANGPEIDVDVVLHGEVGQPDVGPLSAWAQMAAPGDPVALLDQGLLFKADVAAGVDVLMVGDETAVPAIAGILRSLSPATAGLAIIEVPEAGDVQALAAPMGVDVTWLPRGSSRERPGSQALAAALAALPRDTHPYVYAAGEAAMTRALDNTLRQELDWPKELIHCVGYWHYAS